MGFEKEGHLRWDSLGEYPALTCSIEELAAKTNNANGKAMAVALDKAVGTFLTANKNPGRKVKEIDNRGSHYYLALYWAEALAACGNATLEATFGPVAKDLKASEDE